jgi:farnesyl diphosphate synthase
MSDAHAFLEQEMDAVAQAIDRLFDLLLTVPDDPRARLFEAMRYSAIGGGKRLRPMLVSASSRLFNVSADAAMRVACAAEAVHVYSLIHDDLPCMDDDDVRRGKPTTHKAYDEATAVLAGDGLHALAFEWLAQEETHPDPFVRAELLLELAKAAGPHGMAGGQMMDMIAESQAFDLATVSKLQQLKTGALISFAVESGAILGRVPREGRALLNAYARDVGLAFQIADDLIDFEGEATAAGKAVGKDLASGKATFVSLVGADRARGHAQMLVDQAISHLHAFGQEADMLRAIARYIIERDR